MNIAQRIWERSRAQTNSLIGMLASNAAKQELSYLYDNFDLNNPEHYAHYIEEYYYKLHHFNNIMYK